MIDLTEHLADRIMLDPYFKAGVRDAHEGFKPAQALAQWAQIRRRYGFKAVPTPLLTPPAANAKLAKGETPAYGLTLQHYVTSFQAVDTHRRITVNACPYAGDCVKVCVLNNGNGAYPAVQRARKAKTEFLVRYPLSFVAILAWELVQAEAKHGRILFRPNVNSDVAWERVLPSLTFGALLPGVMSYGYSKRPEVLETNGWLAPAYRVAYSWNEKSEPGCWFDFMHRGGSVAVVTSRKKSDPTSQNLAPGFETRDADISDEWIFETDQWGRGVIGDLSAKGKARSLIGKSGFVVTV